MNQLKQGGIYKIINTENCRFYIGCTHEFYTRFNQHKNLLKNMIHRNQELQRDYNKFGPDAFEYVIVEVVHDGKETFNTKEQEYLDDAFKSYRGELYNIRNTSNMAVESSKIIGSKEQFNIPLPKTLVDLLRDHCKQEGRAMNWVVEKLITEYLGLDNKVELEAVRPS